MNCKISNIAPSITTVEGYDNEGYCEKILIMSDGNTLEGYLRTYPSSEIVAVAISPDDKVIFKRGDYTIDNIGYPVDNGYGIERAYSIMTPTGTQCTWGIVFTDNVFKAIINK